MAEPHAVGTSTEVVVKTNTKAVVGTAAVAAFMLGGLAFGAGYSYKQDSARRSASVVTTSDQSKGSSGSATTVTDGSSNTTFVSSAWDGCEEEQDKGTFDRFVAEHDRRELISVSNQKEFDAVVRRVHRSEQPQDFIVFLEDGTYVVKEPIELDNDGIAFFGRSRDKTIIRGADVFPKVSNLFDVIGQTHFDAHRLTMMGVSASAVVSKNPGRITISDVLFRDAGNIAVHAKAGSTDGVIIECSLFELSKPLAVPAAAVSIDFNAENVRIRRNVFRDFASREKVKTSPVILGDGGPISWEGFSVSYNTFLNVDAMTADFSHASTGWITGNHAYLSERATIAMNVLSGFPHSVEGNILLRPRADEKSPIFKLKYDPDFPPNPFDDHIGFNAANGPFVVAPPVADEVLSDGADATHVSVSVRDFIDPEHGDFRVVPGGNVPDIVLPDVELPGF